MAQSATASMVILVQARHSLHIYQNLILTIMCDSFMALETFVLVLTLLGGHSCAHRVEINKVASLMAKSSANTSSVTPDETPSGDMKLFEDVFKGASGQIPFWSHSGQKRGFDKDALNRKANQEEVEPIFSGTILSSDGSFELSGKARELEKYLKGKGLQQSNAFFATYTTSIRAHILRGLHPFIRWPDKDKQGWKNMTGDDYKGPYDDCSGGIPLELTENAVLRAVKSQAAKIPREKQTRYTGIVFEVRVYGALQMNGDDLALVRDPLLIFPNRAFWLNGRPRHPFEDWVLLDLERNERLRQKLKC